MGKIVFVDLEVDGEGKKVLDYGAVTSNENTFHKNNKFRFIEFIKDYYYICGHNIFEHDSKFFKNDLINKEYLFIDTLYLSPLIYPRKKSYKLLKDYKTFQDQENNPVNDARIAKDLFFSEMGVFSSYDSRIRNIFGSLLFDKKHFEGFFTYLKDLWIMKENIEQEIRESFKNKICENVDLNSLIQNNPIELCYALSSINCDEKSEFIPGWIIANYPLTENVLLKLRATSCKECDYCKRTFNSKKRLKDFFGYDDFRLYNNENLQEQVVEAALNGDSLLAVFPTGGGKSISFQLPALIQGECTRGITVVISPLQSLMKDQVDSLERKGIPGANTINSMLDPIERKKTIDSVYSGITSILYISPELMRSKTIENLLMSRHINRVVIDEAHCFSSWGQDFRVDYRYIATFIKKLQEKKNLVNPIPVSCFTATAKPEVIKDICDYFRLNLNLNISTYISLAERTNLKYMVEIKENDEDKYRSLRKLIIEKDCPTIVYVTKIKTTNELAERLTRDGIEALPYNGKMDKKTKKENQEMFLNNKKKVMVATSAFGMGVDKPDVKLVVHYQISSSLEEYLQEAGRAGRDSSIEADCYVYFNESDLDSCFSLLKKSKISINEINHFWTVIKNVTKNRDTLSCSALELARLAGWENENDVETRVKTVITALENAKMLERGTNSPRIFATSIKVKRKDDGVAHIKKSKVTDDEEKKEKAIEVFKTLFDSNHKYVEFSSDADSRVDCIADKMDFGKKDVVTLIGILRQMEILADENDMTASMNAKDSNKIGLELDKISKLELFILDIIESEKSILDLRAINDKAIKKGIKNSTVKEIKKIFLFWTGQNYIENSPFAKDSECTINFKESIAITKEQINTRITLAKYIYEYLLGKIEKKLFNKVEFSLLEVLNKCKEIRKECVIEDIQNALYYLSKMTSFVIEGGFLVIYNSMQIKRVVKDNKVKYKKEDYKDFENHYLSRVQQIHIVGEYAKMMIKSKEQAMEFIKDYFILEYDKFLKKYFKDERREEIKRSVTVQKYEKIMGGLSISQRRIIDDVESKNILVLAGPGSGKTKVLVHKLASLLTLEDVKNEQLLMLTFSRQAANNFKTKLIELIKGQANYVDIKTFHSFSFDLVGKMGDESEFENIVKEAAEMIENGEAEEGKITRSVLVIDEAQDMSKNELRLVKALRDKNPDMRLIAVGDDDQNIFKFRGSDSLHFKELIFGEENGKEYELLDNYRSSKKVISYTNQFAKRIDGRFKKNEMQSVRNDDGKVKITEYKTNNIEEALVKDVIINMQANGGNERKVAILTRTNEEALYILGVLKENDIPAKLIQSNDDFKLINLLEIRTFCNNVDEFPHNGKIITEDVWERGRNDLNNKFSNSKVIKSVNKLLDNFEFFYKTKYISDLKLFIAESKLEEYEFNDFSKVIVSTIHKAKGKEFDDVYMMIKDYDYQNRNQEDDDINKILYVGFTRAKDNLFIHAAGDCLKDLSEYCDYNVDDNEYSQPKNIIIHLGLKKLFLDSFLLKKEKIENFYSGMQISFFDNHFTVNNDDYPFRLSKEGCKNINCFLDEEYTFLNGEIEYIVYWRPKNSDKKDERLIILPTFYLRKEGQNNDNIFQDIKPKKKEMIKPSEYRTNDKELYEKLKKLRSDISRRQYIAAYYIFNNRTLDHLIEKKPTTIEELKNIYGLSANSVKINGEDIIGVIKDFIETDGYQLLYKEKDFIIPLTDEYYITNIVKYINDYLKSKSINYRFSSISIIDFLIENKYLENTNIGNSATEKGKKLGIRCEIVERKDGNNYTKILYFDEAIKFIFDNLYSIYLKDLEQ